VRLLNDSREFVGSASSITGSDRRLAPDRNGYDRPETHERSVFSGICKYREASNTEYSLPSLLYPGISSGGH
jgi:hypothetical protein